ncbi:hypothetical protein C2869_17725 [Saccharobesus litoralis]|uniref:Periplasmic chaperone for outer membrane proteins Skp n=1 Tax=Saccharobesus litoralis TaxID=2172099 RepID=A0A2S0VVD8_9ALTE|nr:OmpH family outer membrane protein [Saccharobesus litoralis]AWB68143.1 hypothetical protein C2869_17725 [Saccharobesus litoralis]
MKKLTLAASLLLALTSGFASVANAAQKIGIVDVQAVFQQLPQAAAIQNTIESEFKDRVEEVRRMEQDIKYYMDKQKREAATMSEAEKQENAKKVLSLRDDFTKKAQGLDQEMRRRSAEERNKLLVLIKQNIDAIAAEGKYDLILRKESVPFYANESDNISAKLVDKISKIK